MTKREKKRVLEDELALAALRNGQTFTLRATSRSMEPFIRPGDRLLARGEPVEVGDIALVRLEGQWITHRVQHLAGDTVWLIADAGGEPHGVDMHALVGRIIAVQRPSLPRQAVMWLRRIAARLLWK